MIKILSLFALVSVANAAYMYQIGNCRYNDNTIIENGVSRSPNSTESAQIQNYNQIMREWKMNNKQNFRDSRFETQTVAQGNQGATSLQRDQTYKTQIQGNRYETQTVAQGNQGATTLQRDQTNKPQPPCLCAAQNC